LSAEWQVMQDPNGQVMFFNTLTKMSTYQHPRTYRNINVAPSVSLVVPPGSRIPDVSGDVNQGYQNATNFQKLGIASGSVTADAFAPIIRSSQDMAKISSQAASIAKKEDEEYLLSKQITAFRQGRLLNDYTERVMPYFTSHKKEKVSRAANGKIIDTVPYYEEWSILDKIVYGSSLDLVIEDGKLIKFQQKTIVPRYRFDADMTPFGPTLWIPFLLRGTRNLLNLLGILDFLVGGIVLLTMIYSLPVVSVIVAPFAMLLSLYIIILVSRFITKFKHTVAEAKQYYVQRQQKVANSVKQDILLQGNEGLEIHFLEVVEKDLQGNVLNTRWPIGIQYTSNLDVDMSFIARLPNYQYWHTFALLVKVVLFVLGVYLYATHNSLL